MANNILTPSIITREALRVLHGKLSFIGGVNRQYDNRFAQTGAKIGTTLNIRKPAKYTVRTGANLSAQDHVETSMPLTVSSQYGVDVSFTTLDLTMSLDDFSKRFIAPAMAQLAAKLESDALTSAVNYVNNYVGTTTTDMTFLQFQQGGQILTENLSPYDQRMAVLNPRSRVQFADAVKGLFQDSGSIANQYREGIMGRTGGFDVYENTFLPTHTNGTLAGSAVTTGTGQGVSTTANSWASQTTLSITGMTSGTTLLAGDIITLSGVYDCHPETKVSTGRLKRFVIQSNVTLTTQANSYAFTFRPAMMWGTGNAFQNVVLSGVSDTSGLTVTLQGAASTAYGNNLQFHPDAFVFATADLEDVSQYGAWGAREVQDGISMRIARQYAISTDTVPCRIDVLWGFADLYASHLAVRSIHQLT